MAESARGGATGATGAAPAAGAAGAAAEAAAALLPDRIAFLGLGLIGGSIALALRGAGYRGTIAAWTPQGRGPTEALDRGIIDAAAPDAEATLAGAGLVILAGPPLAIVESARWLGGSLGEAPAPGATVTDVGSTKARIVTAANEAGLVFVGGHPMAGRETTGIESATAELFLDRPWVIVPGSRAAATDIERVEALATATGARPIHLASEEHDAAVASISHLPLVLAAALVQAVALEPAGAPSWPLARSLAASGWRDTTRLARGDPEMGAGILATNGDAVAARLRTLRGVIDRWIATLEAGDEHGRALRDELELARLAIRAEPR